MHPNNERQLTAGSLKEILDYNPGTGIFSWKIYRNRPAKLGQKCGCVRDGKYFCISINYVDYFAHRLAWLYMTGEWPENTVDHKNRIKTDNRWCNLREATYSQNIANSPNRQNSSGYRGSYKRKDRKNMWRAVIMKEGKRINLGYYKSAKEAHDAYLKGRKILFGEFGEHI